MAQKRHVCQRFWVLCTDESTCYCYYTCYYRCRRAKRTPLRRESPAGAGAASAEESFYPSVVRVILAGGVVEVYPSVVPAREVMDKHPGLCVARPEVFTRPRESLVGPTEKLLPGEKFYLVPYTTVKKLRERQGTAHRRQHPGGMSRGDGGGAQDVEVGVAAEAAVSSPLCEAGDGKEVADGEWVSAKDFYVSKEKWRKCIARRKLVEAAAGGDQGPRKLSPQAQPSRPQQKGEPIVAPPRRRKLGSKGLGWKPSLQSIEEISP